MLKAINQINSKLDAMARIDKANQPKIDGIATVITNLTVLETKIDKAIDEINRLEGRQLQIEGQIDNIYAALNSLSASQSRLEDENNRLQQINLQNHFIVRGLPPGLSKEAALETIKNFGTKIGVKLEESDFKTKPYFVRQKDNKSAHILGVFHDNRTKQQLIWEYKKFNATRPIPVEDVVPGIPKDSPFRGKRLAIRNFLTRYNRSLLYQAHQHPTTLKHAWENDGRILVRRGDGTPIIQLHTEQHLLEVTARIKASNQATTAASSGSQHTPMITK